MFICCGWTYRSITMPLPPHLFAQIWEIDRNPGSLLGYKEWYHCAVVEALDPPGLVPTSTSSIYKEFDNVHMLWMGIWIWIHHHPVTTTLVGPDLGSRLKSAGSLLGATIANDHCGVVEALDPPGLVPTSTSSIYTEFDNVHMLWMGIWIHHHAVTTTLVGPDLGNWPKSWVTAGLQNRTEQLRKLGNVLFLPRPF